MKIVSWLVMISLLGVSGATSLWAQADKELEAVIDGLENAGSYTWERRDSRSQGEVGGVPIQQGRTDVWGEGKTEVDGYTMVVTKRIKAVRLGPTTVIELPGGWKHPDDMSADEIQKSGAAEVGVNALRRGPMVLPAPHEILRACLKYGTNIRTEPNAILGDIDASRMDAFMFEGYVRRGSSLGEPSLNSGRSVLGMPPVRSAAPRSRPQPNQGRQVAFMVKLQDGKIAECAVEFIALTTPLTGVNAGGTDFNAYKLTYRISGVGTTRVSVEPTARALFVR